MGLDNLKKKIQTEGTPKAKPKTKLPFQRIVIDEEKGKMKAKSVPISFEQWCKDMDQEYREHEDFEDEEEEDSDLAALHYLPPPELTPRERRQQRERRREEIRNRYRRSVHIPPI